MYIPIKKGKPIFISLGSTPSSDLKANPFYTPSRDLDDLPSHGAPIISTADGLISEDSRCLQ
jgi:hypothetical protein